MKTSRIFCNEDFAFVCILFAQLFKSICSRLIPFINAIIRFYVKIFSLVEKRIGFEHKFNLLHQNPNVRKTISITYCFPDATNNQDHFKDALSLIGQIANERSTHANVLLAGDFNFPSLNRRDGYIQSEIKQLNRKCMNALLDTFKISSYNRLLPFNKGK